MNVERSINGLRQAVAAITVVLLLSVVLLAVQDQRNDDQQRHDMLDLVYCISVLKYDNSTAYMNVWIWRCLSQRKGNSLRIGGYDGN